VGGVREDTIAVPMAKMAAAQANGKKQFREKNLHIIFAVAATALLATS
jgi:hypothetical protein